VLGAQHIIQTLKTHENVKDILTQMELVATALISLAYHEVQEKSKCKLLTCLTSLAIKTSLQIPTSCMDLYYRMYVSDIQEYGCGDSLFYKNL
jgi:hypothetical protein